MVLPVLCVVLLAPIAAQGQTNGARLRVHPDCNNCFPDYLRDEIRWVDFVRQPQDADVHILATTRQTGGGGQEVTLRFVGLGRFDGTAYELKALSIAGDTDDARRRAVLRAVTVGLLGFLAREGLPATLGLDVEAEDGDEGAAREPGRDPWNFWVFSAGADASYEAEETNRESNWEFDATADRVTDNWKISLGASVERQNEEFDLDEDDPIDVTREERAFDWFVAKSLGRHWSFGIDGDTESSTFGNVKFLVGVAPAIEFNVFPYEQYATRQLRFAYAIGAQHTRYNEETLFGLLEETRPLHQFSVTLDQRQPWGTLQAGVEWLQYLHDVSKSRLEVEGELSLRVARGLSLELGVGASRIQDQLSLPRRGATSEEVLLRLRQLASNYEVQVSSGLRYSFGSIFNNIVNPRFGNR